MSDEASDVYTQTEIARAKAVQDAGDIRVKPDSGHHDWTIPHHEYVKTYEESGGQN